MKTELCSIKGCGNIKYTDICRKHYDQKRNDRGIFRKDFSRRQRDPNEFIIKGKICKIFLYDKQNNKKAEAIIDAEDYERCKQYKWTGTLSAQGNMIVMCNGLSYLNEFIMNFKSTSTMCVDHKNGNTLDNRKENLQIITMQQNQIKKKMQKNNTSGYRGVTWYVNPGKTSAWLAQIYFNYKRYHLGYFKTKEEAALAYNKKAKELFGKFAVLNKIESR
jgi:hypothetical protein